MVLPSVEHRKQSGNGRALSSMPRVKSLNSAPFFRPGNKAEFVAEFLEPSLDNRIGHMGVNSRLIESLCRVQPQSRDAPRRHAWRAVGENRTLFSGTRCKKWIARQLFGGLGFHTGPVRTMKFLHCLTDFHDIPFEHD